MESGVAKKESRETYKGWKREFYSMELLGKLRDRGFERQS
jgi:hypothetical protein